MTLAVDAVVVAGGIFFGRLIARVIKLRTGRSSSGPTADDRRSAVPLQSASDEPLEGFACQLGDVVLRPIEGDEAWLASALVLAEERPVAALFVGPEAQGERAVFVHRSAQPLFTWLRPILDGQITLPPGGEPPRAIEHAGTHFERRRRLPVRVARLGADAPHLGDRAVVGEYAGAGTERLIVIVGSEGALAWRGVALSEGAYEVLPGGKATLEA